MADQPVSMLSTVEDVLKIAQGGAVVVPIPAQGELIAGRVCKTDGQILAALRWAADTWGSKGVVLKSQDGQYHDVDTAAIEALDPLVPTLSRERPLVAFVGKAPSEIDAARGFPLAGMDGDIFKRAYLQPLGLQEHEVMVTNLMPMAGTVTPEVAKRFVGFAKAELNAWQPRLVVALGKAAREELGAMASFCLPHPSVVRRQGDSGELTRKLRKLKGQVEKLRQGAVRKVNIAKYAASNTDALVEKRIVYGVALDPYQYDSQDDWVPAWECESTAHNWLENHRVIGFMHEEQAQAVVVESSLWPYPSMQDYQAAMLNEPHRAYVSSYGSDQVHSGAWLVATRIDDPVIWQAVCDGEIDAYSIGGFGVRTPVTEGTAWPQVEFIQQ